MKKSVCVVVVLAAAMVVSSCSYNTCPTYARQPVKHLNQDAQQSRI